VKSLTASQKADIEAMLKPRAMSESGKRTMLYDFVTNYSASLVFSGRNYDPEMSEMFRLKDDGKTVRSKTDLTLICKYFLK
jgi:hypothetical protein